MIRSTSVSQVELHRLCRRRWRFKHVEKLPDPMAPSAERGIDMHDEIASHLLGNPKGGPYEVYALALKMRGFFPKSDAAPRVVEHRFRMPTHVPGVPLNGVVDLLQESWSWMGDDHGDIATLTDWKSTSDLRWAKKPVEIWRDIQLGTYGEFAYREGLEGDLRVGLVYIEVPKVAPEVPSKVKMIPIFHKVDAAHVSSIWDSMRPDIDQMIEDSEKDDPNDVEPNPLACGKFPPNGCPFQAECGVSQIKNLSRIAPRKKEKTMGFFSSTNGGNGQSAPGKSAPPPAATQTTEAPAAAEVKKGGGFLGQVRQVEQAKAAQVAKSPVPSPGQVVPNDAPPRDSTEPLEAGDPGATKAVKGRPKGSKNKPKDDSDEVSELRSKIADLERTVEAQSEVIETLNEKGPAEVPAKRGFTLYVGCYPTKRPKGELEPTYAEDWIGPAMMELNDWASQEEKVEHYMLLNFGPQKAAFELAIKKHIDKGLPQSMVVSGGIGRELLPLLIPYATTVVRPFRE